MVDAGCVERRDATNEAMNFVAFAQEELGQTRAVLASYQRALRHRVWLLRSCEQMASPTMPLGRENTVWRRTGNVAGHAGQLLERPRERPALTRDR